MIVFTYKTVYTVKIKLFIHFKKTLKKKSYNFCEKKISVYLITLCHAFFIQLNNIIQQ